MISLLFQTDIDAHKQKCVTLMNFPSLAALDIVISTTSGSASDEIFYQYHDISVSTCICST